MQESIVLLLRVQCRRKESSRSLSHLLMSFLLIISQGQIHNRLRGLPPPPRRDDDTLLNT